MALKEKEIDYHKLSYLCIVLLKAHVSYLRKPIYSSHKKPFLPSPFLLLSWVRKPLAFNHLVSQQLLLVASMCKQINAFLLSICQSNSQAPVTKRKRVEKNSLLLHTPVLNCYIMILLNPN